MKAMFILALIASRNIQPLLSDSVGECETVICFMFLNSFDVLILKIILKIKKYYFDDFESNCYSIFKHLLMFNGAELYTFLGVFENVLNVIFFNVFYLKIVK
jgi:hypothetical protein